MSEIFVVGNGRSIKDFDFNFLKDKTWVGLCLAYREWERTGIYPNHYVCVDSVVIKNNIDDIMNLVRNKKCENFILSKSVLEYCPDIKEYCHKKDSPVIFLQDLKYSEFNPFQYLIDYCSGSVAVLWAYLQQKNTINLIGLDCKYVEFIPECVKLNDGTLKIVQEVKDNPNYYFADYQRPGDIYNVPNVNSVHKRSWFHIRNICILYNILTHKEICIYNYNDVDTLKDWFETKPLNSLPNYDSHN